MKSQAESRCPRCGAAFHCGLHDAEPCACAGLVLPAALQADLATRFTGCLCLHCLAVESEAWRQRARGESSTPP